MLLKLDIQSYWKMVFFKVEHATLFMSFGDFLFWVSTLSSKKRLMPHSLTIMVLPGAMHTTSPSGTRSNLRTQVTVKRELPLTLSLAATDGILPYIAVLSTQPRVTTTET